MDSYPQPNQPSPSQTSALSASLPLEYLALLPRNSSALIRHMHPLPSSLFLTYYLGHIVAQATRSTALATPPTFPVTRRHVSVRCSLRRSRLQHEAYLHHSRHHLRLHRETYLPIIFAAPYPLQRLKTRFFAACGVPEEPPFHLHIHYSYCSRHVVSTY